MRNKRTGDSGSFLVEVCILEDWNYSLVSLWDPGAGTLETQVPQLQNRLGSFSLKLLVLASTLSFKD